MDIIQDLTFKSISVWITMVGVDEPASTQLKLYGPFFVQALDRKREAFLVLKEEIENFHYVEPPAPEGMEGMRAEWYVQQHSRLAVLRSKYGYVLKDIWIETVLLSACACEAMVNELISVIIENQETYDEWEKRSPVAKWQGLEDLLPGFLLKQGDELSQLIFAKRNLLVHSKPRVEKNGQVIVAGASAGEFESETEKMFLWYSLPMRLLASLSSCFDKSRIGIVLDAYDCGPS